MDTTVSNSNSNLQSSGTTSAPIHRNSPEEWLALSEEDFKEQLNQRAEHALNSPRSSWQDVKKRIDRQIDEWRVYGIRD